ncbi:unnamed protein product [Pedinophyceae sp. YPF-701]|nr:unnamed protein product [Pedinophyceae sp. YPF-701]
MKTRSKARRTNEPSFLEIEPKAGFALRGQRKLHFVTGLFDTIARTYDLLNIFISLGMTSVWRWLALSALRKRVVPQSCDDRHVSARPGRVRRQRCDDSDDEECALSRSHIRVLDVGCGTGASTRAAARRMRACAAIRGFKLHVEGLDCSPEMLRIAGETKDDACCTYTRGDAENLPYRDGVFDAVLSVYTLRNFGTIAIALKEMVRVTRSGGSVLLLDAFVPRNVVVRALLRVWMRGIVPAIAGLLSHSRAYEYLAESIQGSTPAADVAAMLRKLGCVDVQVVDMMFGSAAYIVATKQ